MDILTPEQRRRNMQAITGKNTKPEKIVRSILHRLGYRFRLHSKNLPGKPDIVLPKYKTVVLVNGCFWHRHEGCRYTTTPATNTKRWQEKFDANVARDKVVGRQLKKLGLQVIVVWECETRDVETLAKRVRRHLRARLKRITPPSAD